MIDKKEALTKINSLIEKLLKEVNLGYKVDCFKSDINTMIKIMEVCDTFGLSRTLAENNPSWDNISISQERRVSLHGEKYRRTISWSDDGKQPDEGEWLYVITFSSGAYFLHEKYPTDLFNELWQDLKSYKPKYIDTVNHCLYYAPQEAKSVHEAYEGIIKKYRGMVKDHLEKKRIEELKAELEKLEHLTKG